jgi:carboxypeptidase C (cathepsin A)
MAGAAVVMTVLWPAHPCGIHIEIFRFCKELLRREGRTVGRLDTRYTGFDRDAAGEEFEFDPAMVEILGAYSAAMNDYVRSDLKFEADLPYEVIKAFYVDWGWKDFANAVAIGYIGCAADSERLFEDLRDSEATSPAST